MEVWTVTQFNTEDGVPGVMAFVYSYKSREAAVGAANSSFAVICGEQAEDDADQSGSPVTLPALEWGNVGDDETNGRYFWPDTEDLTIFHIKRTTLQE